MENPKIISLGLKPYDQVLDQQLELREKRRRGEIVDTILIVEHPKVITEGRRPAQMDYLVAPETLKKAGYEVHKVNRGGRLTYHGPGQMVVYFIISLSTFGMSVPRFVSAVEETAIRTLGIFGVRGERRSGCPGVWVKHRKIASIGLAIDRGISMHGMAININPNLRDFEVIVSCGMEDCQITSLYRETGIMVDLKKVEEGFRGIAKEFFFSPKEWNRIHS